MSTETVYDIAEDRHVQKIVDERRKVFGDDFYVTDYGRYGTKEWIDNLHNEGILVQDECRVKEFKEETKASIPQLFLVSCETGEEYTVVVEGEMAEISCGEKIRISLADRSKIFTSRDAEGWKVLKIEKI